MTTPNTHRIAAAFQAGKDPQQDAVIAWVEALPKDSRGGVKRSVLKYHLTRALLLYMQSGADTSTALHIGAGAPVPSPGPQRPAPLGSAPTSQAAPVFVAPAATPSTPSGVPSVGPVAGAGVPVLNDPVRKTGGLRGKIARSMQAAS